MANSGGHFAQLVRVEKFLFVGHAKVTLGKLGRLMGGLLGGGNVSNSLILTNPSLR